MIKFEVRLWLLFLAVVGSMSIASSLFASNVFTMPNHSMAPTIEKGERVMADMKAYEIADPKTGDLVIFIPNENRDLRWVFRVAAVPGDRLSYRNEVLERNGEAIYAPAPLHDQTFKSPDRMKGGSEINFPYELKDGEYFLLSDDPSHMHDSRYWGIVEKDQILGKLSSHE